MATLKNNPMTITTKKMTITRVNSKTAPSRQSRKKKKSENLYSAWDGNKIYAQTHTQHQIQSHTRNNFTAGYFSGLHQW